MTEMTNFSTTNFILSEFQRIMLSAKETRRKQKRPRGVVDDEQNIFDPSTIRLLLAGAG
jgi:hypothetical protein